MSYDRLMQMIDEDEKRQSNNVENGSLQPKEGTDNQSEENVELKSNDDSGNDSNDNDDTSTHNDGEIKDSETPKDNVRVDKSKLTDKQKAEYAFRKQFSKQERKHKSEIDLLRKEIEELRNATKKPEPVVTRDNFDSEEEYIQYKVNESLKSAMNEQRKEQDALTQQREASEIRKTNIVDRVNSLYEDESERQLYNKMVKYAIDNGLQDALNHQNGKEIREFIDNSEIGPRILQHLIGFPDKFNEIFNMNDPVDKKLELRLLERDVKQLIAASKNKKSSELNNKQDTQTKSNVPVIGKLGVHNNNGATNRSSKEEDNWALKFIRGR